MEINRTLLQNVADGSNSAFSELFELMTPKLQYALHNILRTEDSIQEVVQETFIRIWIKKEKLPELQNPAAWIYKIALNESFTYLNKLAIRSRHYDIFAQKANYVAENSAIPNIELAETSAVVEKALSNLSPQKQLIYRLHKEQGLKTKEIADRLHLSHSHIRNSLSSTLQYIRSYLSGYAHVVILITLFFKK